MNENQLQQQKNTGNLDFEEFDFESMEVLLNEEINDISFDLEKLGNEKELLTNPNSFGKEIYKSIFDQLGAQSGMELSSKSQRQNYAETHIGETSKSAGVEALKDHAYTKVRDANTSASKSKNGINDDYTGKNVKFSEGHKINTDHVVSRKEIYGTGFKKRLRELSGNDVKDLANLSDNLKATNESLNKSKQDKSVGDYAKTQSQRVKDLTTQNEKKNEKVQNSNLSDSEKKHR